MKERRGAGGDRFAVFPFSIGCMSQSSVAVADPINEKKTQSDPSSAATATTTATAQSKFLITSNMINKLISFNSVHLY